jgi:hypothetical protein
VTKITSTVGPPAEAEPVVLYTASYTTEGASPQDAMKDKIDLLIKTLQVQEH